MSVAIPICHNTQSVVHAAKYGRRLIYIPGARPGRGGQFKGMDDAVHRETGILSYNRRQCAKYDTHDFVLTEYSFKVLSFDAERMSVSLPGAQCKSRMTP